jgi:hypothetical protein
VLNLHLVLTQALGQAVRWGICAQNPVKGAQPPRRGLQFSEPKTRKSRRAVALPEFVRPPLKRARSEQGLRRSKARTCRTSIS